jgi:hypothetical protein
MSFGILFSPIHTFHFPTIVTSKWLTVCMNMVHACALSYGGGSHPFCCWTWCKLIWLCRTSRAMEPAKVDLHPHSLVGVVQEFTVFNMLCNYFLIPTHKCEKLDNTKWEMGIEISTPELIIHHGLPIIFYFLFLQVYLKITVSCAYLLVRTQFHAIKDFYFIQSSVYKPLSHYSSQRCLWKQ